jgi:hypothetical protein
MAEMKKKRKMINNLKGNSKNIKEKISWRKMMIKFLEAIQKNKKIFLSQSATFSWIKAKN